MSTHNQESKKKRQKSKASQVNSQGAPMHVQWRFVMVLVVLVAVFLSIAGRAAYIQIIKPDMLIEQGDKRTLRVRDNVNYRGLITDRNGQQLAVSIPAKAIFADPKVIFDNNALEDKDRWQALAIVLEIDVETLQSRVSDPKKRFVYLKRQVTPAMSEFVKNLKLPGIYLRDESKRYYPMGEVSAHIVGFTDVDDIGQEGIEKLYNKSLTGTPDKRRISINKQGRQIEIHDQEVGKKAEDLQLTIDQRIQALAYREIKAATLRYEATSASVVIVDVNNGELLAMANTPSFNPNNRKTVSGHRVRNRAVSDPFEPGSSLKPLAVLAGLEFGSIDVDTIIDTSPGEMFLGGSRVSDPSNYGKLSLSEIIKRSSNMGTSKIALEITQEFFMDTYYNMGLMSTTGLNMLGETDGIFHHRSKWSKHEISTLSFGYNIAVTAAQLARMYATIANGGVQYPLSIVLNQPPLEEPVRVVDESNARALVRMMESATERGGSGFKARVPGYRIAGKTGTSRKAVPGGYGEEYINVFAGIAPASNPQVAIVVVINEPGGDLYHAGDTAAPTFSKIAAGALQLLNVPPDSSQLATNFLNADANPSLSMRQGGD